MRSGYLKSSGAIRYTVERSNKIAGVKISVDAEKGAVVTAPPHCRLAEIEKIVREKTPWIEDKLRLLENQIGCRVPREFVDGEKFFYLGERYTLVIGKTTGVPGVVLRDREIHVALNAAVNSPGGLAVRNELIKWYRERARQVIINRVDWFAAAAGHKPAAVRIKTQKSRWGSCSAKNNLNFNWKLVMAPLEVLDYVVVHELCHLTRLDHSADFWRLVAALAPDYQKKRRWLKEYGPALNI
ncbi:MAG: M48 family metallopeptidase [Firmicutes bacterium]|nr:M48 family metallopeptidase [Bacillota bacterium]